MEKLEGRGFGSLCENSWFLAASGFSQSITVSSASNPPNTTILVSGSGFPPGRTSTSTLTPLTWRWRLLTEPALFPRSPFGYLPQRCRENTW